MFLDRNPGATFIAHERAVNFSGIFSVFSSSFLSLGAEISPISVVVSPLLIVLVWAVAKGSRLSASYLLFWGLLEWEHSLLSGLGLSVRFSTNLIVQFVLLKSGSILLALYSALVLTAVLTKPVILLGFSEILSKDKAP